MNANIRNQIRIAQFQAMDHGRPFSWLHDKTVQAGVYLNYSQSLFHTLRIAK